MLREGMGHTTEAAQAAKKAEEVGRAAEDFLAEYEGGQSTEEVVVNRDTARAAKAVRNRINVRDSAARAVRVGRVAQAFLDRFLHRDHLHPKPKPKINQPESKHRQLTPSEELDLPVPKRVLTPAQKRIEIDIAQALRDTAPEKSFHPAQGAERVDVDSEQDLPAFKAATIKEAQAIDIAAREDLVDEDEGAFTSADDFDKAA